MKSPNPGPDARRARKEAMSADVSDDDDGDDGDDGDGDALAPEVDAARAADGAADGSRARGGVIHDATIDRARRAALASSATAALADRRSAVASMARGDVRATI
jgi:hypothetical protein